MSQERWMNDIPIMSLTELVHQVLSAHLRPEIDPANLAGLILAGRKSLV